MSPGKHLEISGFLKGLLRRQIPAETMMWLSARVEAARGSNQTGMFTGFSMASRKLGKTELVLAPEDLAQAESLRPKWNPRGWTVDQAARTILVLEWPSADLAAYVNLLDKLFAAGEVGELVALYQALPLLPNPETHAARCAEGTRTNIIAVFAAVAHRNPFPAEHLPDTNWNQMVVKALFMDLTLAPIVGLDARANSQLRQILVDHAHERRSAGRTYSPEIWRCIAPFADDAAMDELQRVLETGTLRDHQAAALALSTCPHPRAKSMLAAHPDLSAGIQSGEIDWFSISIGIAGIAFALLTSNATIS